MLAKGSLVAIFVLVLAASAAAYALNPSSNWVSGSPTTSTTSTTCTTRSTSGLGPGVNGTFTVNSSSPIRVDYVKAVPYTLGNGSRTLQFEVGFTNVGQADVYFVRGCGSSLSSQIIGDSQLVQTEGGGPRCLCAEAPSAVTPGETSTAVDPGCWSSYSYRLLGTGTFSARLVLNWSGSASFPSQWNATVITATFVMD